MDSDEKFLASQNCPYRITLIMGLIGLMKQNFTKACVNALLLIVDKSFPKNIETLVSLLLSLEVML